MGFRVEVLKGLAFGGLLVQARAVEEGLWVVWGIGGRCLGLRA